MKYYTVKVIACGGRKVNVGKAAYENGTTKRLYIHEIFVAGNVHVVVLAIEINSTRGEIIPATVYMPTQISGRGSEKCTECARNTTRTHTP